MQRHVLAASTAAFLLVTTTANAEAWPDLPIGIKNGFAARVGEKLFTGLGSAGTQVYMLDLSNRSLGWQSVAPFIGPETSQPATAVSGGNIYVFSGSGKTAPDAASPIVFDTAYRYLPSSNAWEKLATTAPAGLLGASAVTRSDGTIAIFGGYNKELFDKYLSDITHTDKTTDPATWEKIVHDFMGMKPEDYHWNDKVRLFDPATNSWSDLGENPYLPNCGAALVETAKDSIALINGEIKPGLRTDAVKSVNLSGRSAEWTSLPPIPQGASGKQQEGLAGAYAGYVDGTIIVAAGANFPGARANADAGRWFAHEGLSKSYSTDVFTYTDGKWDLAGELPEGLAYGASFSLPEGLLIVGGEDSNHNARAEVFLLTIDGMHDE